MNSAIPIEHSKIQSIELKKEITYVKLWCIEHSNIRRIRSR
jgi:hypothetical protein